MPRSYSLGNGTVLINLDGFGQVKDFYFHYPGLENHISEYLVHKIGVFTEEKFSWLDESWEIVVSSRKDTMASDIKCTNSTLGIELHLTDIIYNEANIFIREVDVKNLFDRNRKVKVFFNQQFNISQTNTGETAYYDPREKVVIHYKGRRVFLINCVSEKEFFDDYSVGLLGVAGRDGTFRDSEDGELSKNPIEHGRVDSVIAREVEIEPKSVRTIYYWVTVGKSLPKVKTLNETILARGPADIVKTTVDYWKAWIKHQNFSFYGLGPPIVDLFNQSLVNIRTHVAKNGGIIASGDSDILKYWPDTYAYVWMRDAAFCAIALEKAGDFNASRRFFEFSRDVITPEGYFMHKYSPDKSLGSSWHPWERNGQKQFPIQEDETALVIWALWQHYELSRDLEFIEEVYNELIKRSAEFMVNYRDGKTGLCSASYDLWEERYGIYTFTSSTVFGALNVASRFATLLGKSDSAAKYEQAASIIKKAIMKYLYNEEEGTFYKSIDTTGKSISMNRAIDISSVYGIYKFGVLPIDDPKLKKAIEKTVERLEVKTQIGGMARYEGDAYHHVGGDVPGNPWIITTMWLAQYYISLAKSESDMEPVRKLITWVTKRASTAGVLPEQVDPYSGEHVSASPLAWSHAEYVTTIVNYLEKLEELGVCKACYPIT